jgi:hypothetical protein
LSSGKGQRGVDLGLSLGSLPLLELLFPLVGALLGAFGVLRSLGLGLLRDCL